MASPIFECFRGTNGASIMLVVMVLTMITFASHSVTAIELEVGGNRGWTLDYDYTSWASTTVVQPGDILVFNYNPRLHNLLVVNKADFDSCSDHSPLLTLTSGQDHLTLPQAGNYYFICGFGIHCNLGMKLAVEARG